MWEAKKKKKKDWSFEKCSHLIITLTKLSYVRHADMLLQHTFIYLRALQHYSEGSLVDLTGFKTTAVYP